MQKRTFTLLSYFLLIFIFLINTKLIAASPKDLINAIKTGNFNKVKKLVNSGLNINAKFRGKAPLIEAVNAKRFRIAKYLINKGANIRIQDKDKDTALIIASLRGSLNIVRLVIRKGTRINHTNRFKRTA